MANSLSDEHAGARLSASSEVGARGERLALEFLERAGYRIVMANFIAPIGRGIRGSQVNGEIDIVALDGDTLCFVEVKSRSSADLAGPLQNVDIRKQRVVTRTARVYRRVFAISSAAFRFDVVTVVASPAGNPQLELHKGFWSESKFRKRRWAIDRF